LGFGIWELGKKQDKYKTENTYMKKNIVIIAALLVLTAAVMAGPWDAGVNISPHTINMRGAGFTTDTTAYIRLPYGNVRNLSLRIGDTDDGLFCEGGTAFQIVFGGSKKGYLGQVGIGSSGSAMIVPSPTGVSASLRVKDSDSDTGLQPGPTASTDDTLALEAGGTRGVIVKQAAGQGWNNNLQVEIAGDLAISNSGNLTGNANTRGSDSFAGTAVVDTIYNLDFAVGDNFVVSWNYALTDSNCFLAGVCVEDYLIVNRAAIAAGEAKANAGYNWQRQK